MRKLTIIPLLFLFLPSLLATNDNKSADAPSLGLGGASVALENVYANYNNQAILGLIEATTIASSFSQNFAITDVRVMAALPVSFGTLGFNVSRLGTASYADLKFGAAYARTFGTSFSAALQADLLSVMPSPNESSVYAFSAELALWARPLQDLTLGFHLYNFINANYALLYYDEAIPVSMKLGFGYSIFDNFLFTGELENNSIYGTSVRGGMEYNILDQLVFRTGAASNPALASLGLGVTLGGFQVDIAAQAVRNYGKNGAVSLSYTF